jgi:hypothetical protein
MRLNGEQRSLGVQSVEDGLDQEQIGPAVEQPANGLAVGVHQIVESDVPESWIVHIRGERCRAVGRPQHTGDVSGHLGGTTLELVGHVAGNPRRGMIQLVDQILHSVVSHGDCGGVEGIGFQDVRTGIEVSLVNGADDAGLGE